MKKFLSNITNPNILSHLKQYLEKEREKEDKDFAKWKKRHFQTTALNDSEAISEESSAEEEETDAEREETDAEREGTDAEQEENEASDTEEVVSSQFFSVEQKESDDSSSDDPRTAPTKLNLKTLKNPPINPQSTSEHEEDLSSFFRDENLDFEATAPKKTGWSLFSDEEATKSSEENQLEEDISSIIDEEIENFRTARNRIVELSEQRSSKDIRLEEDISSLEEKESDSSQKSCTGLHLEDFGPAENLAGGLPGAKSSKHTQPEADISSLEEKKTDSQKSNENLHYGTERTSEKLSGWASNKEIQLEDEEIESSLKPCAHLEDFRTAESQIELLLWPKSHIQLDKDISFLEEKETDSSQKSSEKLNSGTERRKKEMQLEEEISSPEDNETESSLKSYAQLQLEDFRTTENQIKELLWPKSNEIQLEEDISSLEEKETDSSQKSYEYFHLGIKERASEGLSGRKSDKEMQLEEDISSQEEKETYSSQKSCRNLHFAIKGRASEGLSGRKSNKEMQLGEDISSLAEKETDSSKKFCKNPALFEESQPEMFSGTNSFKEMQLKDEISPREDETFESSQKFHTRLIFGDLGTEESQIQEHCRPKNFENSPIEKDYFSISSPEEIETVRKSNEILHSADSRAEESQLEDLFGTKSPKGRQLEEETVTSPVSSENCHFANFEGENFEKHLGTKDDEEMRLEELENSLKDSEKLAEPINDEESPEEELVLSQYFPTVEEKEESYKEPTERNKKKINLKKLSQKSRVSSESEDEEEAVCSQFFPKSQETFQEEMDRAAELLKNLVEESETKPKKRCKRKPNNGSLQVVAQKGTSKEENEESRLQEEANATGESQEPVASKIPQGGAKCRKAKKGKSSQELPSSEDPGVCKEFAPDVLHKYLEYSTFKKRPRLKLQKDSTLSELPPGALTPLWSPPRSPHGLIEEDYVENPWGLLVATIFLNKTKGKQAKPVIDAFLKEFSNPYEVLKRDSQDLERFFDDIGLRKRAEQIWKMSQEFVGKSWRHAKELHGIGKYGDDAFRIFCLGDLSCEPEDRYLRIYHAWVTKKKGWDDEGGVGEEERSEDVGDCEEETGGRVE